jgi:hypothetical protein
MKLNLGGGGASITMKSFPKDFNSVKALLPTNNNISKVYYVDSDNDRIDLSEDEDLREAGRYSQMKGLRILDVHVMTKAQVNNSKESKV